MPKLRYEVDPHNRLTAHGPYKYRHVYDGQFKLEEGNKLVYHIKKSDAKTPQQVRFSGQWQLDEKHRLVLTLDKWGEQVAGNKLVMTTEMIDATGHELALTVTTRDRDNTEHISLLRFSGAWQADPHNRLVFCVDKGMDQKDELVFRGIWSINKNNQLEYLVAKKRHFDDAILVFRGHWDILGHNRLSYILSESGKSGFDFKIELDHVTRNAINATVGIGVDPFKQKISVSGKWNVLDDAKASFDVNYGRGEVSSISVKLTKLLSTGEAYVRFTRSAHEFEVLGGIGITA